MGIIRGSIGKTNSNGWKSFPFSTKKDFGISRGSISVKERNGKRYIYLARREDKKVVFDYIGKDAPAVWAALNEKLKQRKEYQAKLCQVKENLREVERSLRGKRT